MDVDELVPTGVTGPVDEDDKAIWLWGMFGGQPVIRKKGGVDGLYLSEAAIFGTPSESIDFSAAIDPPRAEAFYNTLLAKEEERAEEEEEEHGHGSSDDSSAALVPEAPEADQGLASALTYACSHAPEKYPGSTNLTTTQRADGRLELTVRPDTGHSLAWNPILEAALASNRKDPAWNPFYKAVAELQRKSDSLEKNVCVVMKEMREAGTFPHNGPIMPLAEAMLNYGYCAADIAAFFKPGKVNGEAAAVVVESADGKDVLICMLVKSIGCPKWKVYVLKSLLPLSPS